MKYRLHDLIKLQHGDKIDLTRMQGRLSVLDRSDSGFCTAEGCGNTLRRSDGEGLVSVNRTARRRHLEVGGVTSETQHTANCRPGAKTETQSGSDT